MTTQADERRYRFLFDFGCICCHLRGTGYSMPQMHHIVDKGYRKHSGGNQATLPLCPWHHQGKPPGAYTNSEATLRFGPALEHGSKPFHAVWGTQRELLAIIDKAIEEAGVMVLRPYAVTHSGVAFPTQTG